MLGAGCRTGRKNLEAAGPQVRVGGACDLAADRSDDVATPTSTPRNNDAIPDLDDPSDDLPLRCAFSWA